MGTNSSRLIILALWAISLAFPANAEGQTDDGRPPAVGGYGTYCFVNVHLKVECVKLSAFA
jgi:hypothetical protein